MYSNKGITLIELLVSIAIFLIFIALVYSTFIHQYKNYKKENSIISSQQEGKIIMNTIANIIRMAGYGYKNGKDINGFSKTFTVFNTNPTNGSDNVTVISAIKKVATVIDNVSESNIVHVAQLKTNSLDTQHKRYIFFEDNDVNDFNAISSISGESDNLTLALDNKVLYTFSGEPVYLVEAYTIGVKNDNLIINENTGGGAQPASNSIIENLQFQYGVDSNGDGNLDQWTDSLSANDIVKAVKIFLLLRSKRKELSYTDTNSYILAGNSFVPNNHYYHYLMQTTVYVRNY